MLLRIVIAVLCCFCISRADNLSVSPANTFLVLGQTLSLDVTLNSVADLYAYQFDLTFDPTVLQALSISEGAFLSGGGPTLFFPGDIDNVGGIIPFNADTLEGFSGVSGSGTLASFDFLAIAPGSTSIDIQNAILLDSTLAGIAFEGSRGNVMVVDTPEPSSLYLLLGAVGVLLGRLRFSASRR